MSRKPEPMMNRRPEAVSLRHVPMGTRAGTLVRALERCLQLQEQCFQGPRICYSGRSPWERSPGCGGPVH
jgi:hypothetical protein